MVKPVPVEAVRGLHQIGRADEMPARLVVNIHDDDADSMRRVLLLKFARGGMNDFVAMDSLCFHQGGRLERGGLAVYAGRFCITCPVHKYLPVSTDSFYPLPRSSIPFPGDPSDLTLLSTTTLCTYTAQFRNRHRVGRARGPRRKRARPVGSRRRWTKA